MTRSAGILLFRRNGGVLEVLLAHPGGPFWARRDDGAWTLPKGEIGTGEDAEAAALREFAEETGVALSGALIALGEVRQRGGKVVIGFAQERDLDPAGFVSNSVTMAWPPKSGRMLTFPEIDRAAWFDADTALRKINPAQGAFVTRLRDTVDRNA